MGRELGVSASCVGCALKKIGYTRTKQHHRSVWKQSACWRYDVRGNLSSGSSRGVACRNAATSDSQGKRCRDGQYQLSQGRIQEFIEAAGCNALYLPPYSPDFNPVEYCWAWLKARVKRLRSGFDTLDEAVEFVLASS